MLEALITSKTRIRLLVKFFLNPAMKTYLRELASEFGESTNSVRVELNRLTEAGLLESEARGNIVWYKARQTHPLFPEINSIVSKFTGVDRIVDDIVRRLGDLEAAYLIGDYAAGRDSGIIDLILVGKVDNRYLSDLIAKAESLINRRIRYLVMEPAESKEYLNNGYQGVHVLLWKAE